MSKYRNSQKPSKYARYAEVVEGGEEYESCLTFYKVYQRIQQTYFDFAKKYGSERIFTFRNLTDIALSERRPDFIKPNQNQYSRPKKGTEAEKEMKALEQLPNIWKLYEDLNIPLEYQFRYEGSEEYTGSGLILTYMFNPPFGFIEDEGKVRFFVIVPDYEGFVKKLKLDQPGAIVNPKLIEWQCPPTIKIITDAEYDYIYAEHRLRKEREEKESL